MFTVNPTFSRTKEEIIDKWKPCCDRQMVNIDNQMVAIMVFKMESIEIEFYPLISPFNQKDVQLSIGTIQLDQNKKRKFETHTTYGLDTSNSHFYMFISAKCSYESNMIITDEEISDMFWFLIHTNYYTNNELIEEIKANMSMLQSQKMRHNSIVLETLKSFKFYNDINSLLIKYL